MIDEFYDLMVCVDAETLRMIMKHAGFPYVTILDNGKGYIIIGFGDRISYEIFRELLKTLGKKLAEG